MESLIIISKLVSLTFREKGLYSLSQKLVSSKIKFEMISKNLDFDSEVYSLYTHLCFEKTLPDYPT